MMARLSWVLIASVAGMSMFFNASLPLHFDEAYYWVWSQHLAWSYFDHPPMIAWLMRIMTVGGQSEGLLRLVAVICMASAAGFVYQLALEMFGVRTAIFALAIFLLAPLTQIGFALATPDAPLILGWTAAVFFAWRAMFCKQRRAFAAFGAALGFALLSKYTAVLLLPAMFCFLVFSPFRNLLLRKDPYIAVAVALLLFLPVVSWNAAHDWASFRFQFAHGVAGEKFWNPDTFFEFWGGQALALNPLFFLALLLIGLWRVRQNMADTKLAFLWWPCFFLLLFFGLDASYKKVEANWAAPAYVTGTILLAYWLERTKAKKFLIGGLALGLFMMLLLRAPELFPILPSHAVMKARFVGQDVLYRHVGERLEANQLIFAGDYKIAALARYYLPGRPEVHVLPPSRKSQFDYWREGIQARIGDDGVFIGSAGQEAHLLRWFDAVGPVETLTIRDPFEKKEITFYVCRGLKAIPGFASAVPPLH